MKKSIVIIVGIVIAFAVILSIGNAGASTSRDENYNDISYEHSKGEQPEPEEISGMNRAEDRTRNKDRWILLFFLENYLKKLILTMLI